MHFEEREAVAQEHEKRVSERDDLVDKGNVGTETECLENELLTVPDAEREGTGSGRRRRVLVFETQQLGVIHGVVILWVEN